MSERATNGAPENDAVRDPVCGRPVDPLRARAVGIFGGVTRYFCSQECKAQFGDPRGSSPADGAPQGIERRLAEGDVSARFFVQKTAPAEPVDRFEDLDPAAAVRESAPDLAPAGRGRLLVLAGVVLLVVVGAIVFFVRGAHGG